mmetsp:Transcript_36325/g.55789  ORF Transcript_36325/g.55789 Transcript_36325/m.55789 type:complete len:121 (+) Transcript_36325:1186-1548(+)
MRLQLESDNPMVDFIQKRAWHRQRSRRGSSFLSPVEFNWILEYVSDAGEFEVETFISDIDSFNRSGLGCSVIEDALQQFSYVICSRFFEGLPLSANSKISRLLSKEVEGSVLWEQLQGVI